MNISGHNDFYVNSQSSFSFSANLQLFKSSGTSTLSLNGESGDLSFSFQNGRIYDPFNKFVWGYRSGDSINLSGDIYNNSLSYYIDGYPICVGRISDNFFTGASFNGNENDVADLNLSLFGKIPDYYFVYSGSVRSGSAVEILMFNNDPANQFFSIFSGGIVSNTFGNYNAYISGIESGKRNIVSGQSFISFSIVPTGNYLNQFEIPVTFYTDFGKIENTFTFSYFRDPIYFHSLNFVWSGNQPVFFDRYTGNIPASGDKIFNISPQYEDYSSWKYGLTLLNEGVDDNIFVSINHLEGSGILLTGTYTTSCTASGYLSGYIYNSGYLYGVIDGIGITVPNFYDQIIYADLLTSGVSGFSYATGCFIYYTQPSAFASAGFYPDSGSEPFKWGTGYYPSYCPQLTSGLVYGITSGNLVSGSGIMSGFVSGNLTGNEIIIYSGQASNFAIPAFPENIYSGYTIVYKIVSSDPSGVIAWNLYNPIGFSVSSTRETGVTIGCRNERFSTYFYEYLVTGITGVGGVEYNGYYENTGYYNGTLLISGGLTGTSRHGSGNLVTPYNFTGCLTNAGSGNFGNGSVISQNTGLSPTSPIIGSWYFPYGWYGMPVSGSPEVYSGISNPPNGYHSAQNVYAYQPWEDSISYVNSGNYTTFYTTQLIETRTGILYIDSGSLSGYVNNIISGLNSPDFSINFSVESGSNYKFYNITFLKRKSVWQEDILNGSFLYVISGYQFVYSGLLNY